MKQSSSCLKYGFTLIEMLAVLAIICVLVGITMAAATKARQKARATFCLNQIRQIGMALGQMSDHGIPGDWPSRVANWHLKQERLLCPEGPQDGGTNYGLNKHLVGRPTGNLDTARTVLLYESRRAGDWVVGDEPDVDNRHLGGCNYVFLDGHARWSAQPQQFAPQ